MGSWNHKLLPTWLVHWALARQAANVPALGRCDNSESRMGGLTTRLAAALSRLPYSSTGRSMP